MKKHIPKLAAVARSRLRDLIRYCDQTPGARAEVANRFKKITGFMPARGQLIDWLHPSPKKWQMPNYGNGVVLEMVWKDLKTELIAEANAICDAVSL